MTIKDNVCFKFRVTEKASGNAFQAVKDVVISSPAYASSNLSACEQDYLSWLHDNHEAVVKFRKGKYQTSKHLPGSYTSAKSVCLKAVNILSKEEFVKAGKTEMQKVIKNHTRTVTLAPPQPGAFICPNCGHSL